MSPLIETLAFALVALLMLGSALLVVRAANLVHAVMWLGVMLLSTAGLYVMLAASFLAAVQALLYVGGVITLMVFGLMITRRHEGIVVTAERGPALRAGLLAGALFCVIAVGVARTPGLTEAPLDAPPLPLTDLGRAILTTHLIAFEALSLLLLAAIIGAIVIARRRDPGVRARGFLDAGGPAAGPGAGR
jgi:NADH-quinone oxidoreductase subunit J